MILNPVRPDSYLSPGKDNPGGWRIYGALLFMILGVLLLITRILPSLLIWREIRAVLGVLWIFLSALGTGLWFFHYQKRSLHLRIVLQAAALGLGSLALLMFLLAVLGCWQDRWVWGLFLLLNLLSLPNWWHLWRYRKRAFRSFNEGDTSPAQLSPVGTAFAWTPIQFILLGFGIIFGALTLLLALLPPMAFDALEYHLGVPWAYWQTGGMRFLPNLFYAHFPMNMEMLFTLIWRIAGEGGIKVFHWMLGVLISVSLYAWLRHRAGKTTALLAAVLFLSDMHILGLLVSAKIDLGVILFSFLAMEALWRWLINSKTSDMILAGVFSGFAVGCKYSVIGILAFPVVMVLLTDALLSREWRHHGKAIVLYGATCLLLFSPWAIRNWVYQGNPVFPLGYSVFGAETMDDEIHQFMVRTTGPTWKGELGELNREASFSARLSGLWDILTQKQPLVMLFLPVLPAVLLIRCERRLRLLCLLLFLGWLVWIAFSRPLPRYLTPLYPAMAGVLMLAINRLSFPALSTLLKLLLGFLLLYNLTGYGILAATLPQSARYLTRQMTREEFLSGMLPHFEAIEFLNRQISRSGSKVLFVAEARGYGCEVPYDLNSVYDRAILLQIIADEPDVRRWGSLLQDAGYTHLLYNPIELHRYRITFEEAGWTEGRMLQDAMQRLEQSGSLQLLYSTRPFPEGAIRIYAIAP